jgi:hypothetical protein
MKPLKESAFAAIRNCLAMRANRLTTAGFRLVQWAGLVCWWHPILRQLYETDRDALKAMRANPLFLRDRYQGGGRQ